MIKAVFEDEWQPVFVLVDESNVYPDIEIDAEFFAEYERIMAEFDALQDKLRHLSGYDRRRIEMDEYWDAQRKANPYPSPRPIP